MEISNILSQISLLYKRKSILTGMIEMNGNYEKNNEIYLVHQDPNTTTYPTNWDDIDIFKNANVTKIDDFFLKNDSAVNGLILYVIYMGGKRFDQSIRDKDFEKVKNKLNQGEIIIVPVIPSRDGQRPNQVPTDYEGDKVYGIDLDAQNKIIYNNNYYMDLGKKIQQ